jgi:hypothetical protein
MVAFHKTMSNAPFSLGSQPQKPAPGLIGPDAAQDRADKTEECGETDDAIDHPAQRLATRRQRAGEEAAHDVNNGQQSRHKHRRIAGRHHHDVGGQPQVGVQHGLQHFHGIAVERQVMGDDQSDEADESRHDQADGALVNFSRIMPSRQAPQPMKMAEEYRLVTGGRPSRYMRKTSPIV